MLNDYIIWNGVSSEDFDNLIVKKIPSLKRPKRKYSVYSVPGRNGDIIIPQDAYEDYEVTYQLFLYTEKKGTDLAEMCAEVSDWLYSTDGDYAEFMDSFEPDVKRYAYISESVDITQALTQYGTVKIKFRFMPKRYLLNGLTMATHETSPITIANPTKFSASPLIYVVADTTVPISNAVITINNDTISISELASDMYIDFEEKKAYDSNGNNLNQKVTLSADEYPSIGSGITTISWTARIKELSIMPRWWRP